MSWRYADADRTVATNGEGRFVPADPANADFVAIETSIGEYVVPPQPVPPEISRRQFYQGLALKGLITQDEAKVAVRGGALPIALETLVGTLPSEAQFAAEMLLSGATSFLRDHPLTATFAADQNPPWSADDIDAFWRFCAAL